MEIKADPKIFHDFHFKIAMPMRLPITSRKVLEEFVDIDVNAQKIAAIIKRNQYFERMLIEEIKTLGMKENTPQLEAAIALLGMSRVRNFVCALQIIRVIARRHPAIGADGKLDFKAADMVGYAVKIEEYMTARKMSYADSGYAAGLMFDMLVQIGREIYEGPKGFEEYVSEVYKHGMRTAIVANEVSKTMKGLGFAKFVFSAAIIHDIGKIAMELLFPPTEPNSYKAFREETTKANLSRELIRFVEMSRFGLTHEFYSAQLAYYFQVFRPIEKALLFHHESYILRTTGKDIYSLSALIAFSSNVANNFRSPKDASDPVFKSWITPDLKDFKVDPKVMIAAMHKIGRESF